MRSLFLAFALACCLTAPVSAQPVTVSEAQPVSDDGDLMDLKQAVARTRTYLSGLSRLTIPLGDRQVPVPLALRTAERFAELLDRHGLAPPFFEAVRTEFDWVAMPGQDGRGTVHVTGYHLPMLEARERPDARFRFPLYGMPPDLVRVDLTPFGARFQGQSLTARIQGNRVLPYFSRTEIDDRGALSGRGLEIAWVYDEMARYSLMVQGSGLLRFGDGRVVNVNYAGANGHPYVSLGKALVADGKIPQATISMPAIEAYFRERPEEMRPYLNRNPSYVFFRLAPEGPFGTDGIPLTAGRAIATDKRLFGSGLVGFLEYPRARFGPGGRIASWEPGGRFVLDQDTGGAIKGPGRVDVYWGGGDEAALRAGTLNGEGRVWYLLLKEEARP